MSSVIPQFPTQKWGDCIIELILWTCTLFNRFHGWKSCEQYIRRQFSMTQLNYWLLHQIIWKTFLPSSLRQIEGTLNESSNWISILVLTTFSLGFYYLNNLYIFLYIKSTLNNYLMWRLAHNYLPYLSREFWEVLDIHKRDTLGMLNRPTFYLKVSFLLNSHIKTSSSLVLIKNLWSLWSFIQEWRIDDFFFLLLLLVGFIIPFFWNDLRRCQGIGGPMGNVHRDDTEILPPSDGFHLLKEQRGPQGQPQRSQYFLSFCHCLNCHRLSPVNEADTTMQPISTNELFVFYFSFIFQQKPLSTPTPTLGYPRAIGGDHLRIAEERLG